MRRVWLYAIRLDDVVLEKKRFVHRNPNHVAGKPCYYVGSSIYPPKVRFEKHKAGERSSWWVREYGLHPSTRTCRWRTEPNGGSRGTSGARAGGSSAHALPRAVPSTMWSSTP